MAEEGAEEVGGGGFAFGAVTFVTGGDRVGGRVVAAARERDDVVELPGAGAQQRQAVEAASVFTGEEFLAHGGVTEGVLNEARLRAQG